MAKLINQVRSTKEDAVVGVSWYDDAGRSGVTGSGRDTLDERTRSKSFYII